MIRIDSLWLAVDPVDMRAGADRLLARVVQVFGSAQAHHGYLFANARATRVKLLVHDGFGAYFSDRGRLFQADRGRRIGAVGDALGKRASSGWNVAQSSTISLKGAVVGRVSESVLVPFDLWFQAPARPPEAPRPSMYSCSVLQTGERAFIALAHRRCRAAT